MQFLELINPCSTEKILKVGQVCTLPARRRL